MQHEPLGKRLRKGAKWEKEEAAALLTGGCRRWPVLLGCRRNASRSHFGGWGLHRQPQPRVTATGVACSELSQQLLKFLNPPRPSFNCLSSFLPHSSRLAHGCNPLSQNGYGDNNNDPDKVSNGKQAARKGFPRRSDDQKSTPVNVSTHITQRRD